jgi:hypothetical protein
VSLSTKGRDDRGGQIVELVSLPTALCVNESNSKHSWSESPFASQGEPLHVAVHLFKCADRHLTGEAGFFRVCLSPAPPFSPLPHPCLAPIRRHMSPSVCLWKEATEWIETSLAAAATASAATTSGPKFQFESSRLLTTAARRLARCERSTCLSSADLEDGLSTLPSL